MDDAAAAVPPDLRVLTGTEREVLEGFRELCRGAVARKLAGVAELDARRSLVPSRTTLLGLVKHLAGPASPGRRWCSCRQAWTALKVKSVSRSGCARTVPFSSVMLVGVPSRSLGRPLVAKALRSSK